MYLLERERILAGPDGFLNDQLMHHKLKYMWSGCGGSEGCVGRALSALIRMPASNSWSAIPGLVSFGVI